MEGRGKGGEGRVKRDKGTGPSMQKFEFRHEFRVHYIRVMKNITLTADEKLIKLAREKASREKTSLNSQFRVWLKRYVDSDRKLPDYESLMDQLSYANAGRKFSRDELNER